MFGLTSLLGGGGGGTSLQSTDTFTPNLGATTATISTGGTSTINFGKTDENDFLKYGIIAGALILALVIFKRKK